MAAAVWGDKGQRVELASSFKSRRKFVTALDHTLNSLGTDACYLDCSYLSRFSSRGPVAVLLPRFSHQEPVFPPLSAGPSGAYSPDATMGYMMDGQAASMMHRPPGDPAFHNQYHYPPEYYGHHL
ncbi:hypothetical protein ANTPLA_LOCUS5604 [Anthophora plagiata]